MLSSFQVAKKPRVTGAAEQHQRWVLSTASLSLPAIPDSQPAAPGAASAPPSSSSEG